MEFSTAYKGQEDEITDLMTATFTASEGAEEGAQIGALASRMMQDTPERDLYVVTAWEEGALAGAIVFSRLTYAGDARAVFVMGPVAVATARQGAGVGQRLITHGLQVLREAGVAIAVTYGDPAFYTRVGFAPVREADLPAPFALQYPHGWLAQSLSGAGLTPLSGPVRCVTAMNDPAYW